MVHVNVDIKFSVQANPERVDPYIIAGNLAALLSDVVITVRTIDGREFPVTAARVTAVEWEGPPRV